MPLPRFDRADAGVRARILAAVRAQAAREGIDRVALQPVIADAGLSRSAAYNYFDGRDDLVDWAIDATVEELRAALGEWRTTATADDLWSRIEDGERRLREHLAADPTRRPVLAAAARPRHDGASRPDATGWMSAAFRDAVRLGLVSPTPDGAVLEAATLAVVAAVDAAELDGGRIGAGTLRLLLGRLWGTAS